MQPFHADVAITSAFNGLPSVFDLTAPLDGVPPTWRIKSMSRRCVGPERRCPYLMIVVDRKYYRLERDDESSKLFEAS
jgi:hypothetical protein